MRTATGYLLLLSRLETASGTSVRRTIGTIVVGPLKAKLEQALPVVATQIQNRLGSTNAPSEFDGWPLAYRVEAFRPTVAKVAIWHLDTAATSALGLAVADYTTTTYTLGWVSGSWRISNVEQASGPTPPGSAGSRAEMDSFARTVSRFSRYAYVP